MFISDGPVCIRFGMHTPRILLKDATAVRIRKLVVTRMEFEFRIMSSSTSTTSTRTARPAHTAPVQQLPPDSTSRIPVTPAVLRSIFASSRTPHEERSISRVAFFRFDHEYTYISLTEHSLLDLLGFY